MILQLTISDEQLAELADMIADRIQGRMAASGKPYAAKEAAEALGISLSTLNRRIRAGEIPKIPGLGRTLIPAQAIDDLLEGKRPKDR